MAALGAPRRSGHVKNQTERNGPQSNESGGKWAPILNIANADRPGYKAVDIDAEEALRNGQSDITDIPLRFHVPSQSSIDGNTVEMDVERAKFAQNALMYEFALDRVKGHYMHMMELLKDLKD